ncbi:MAG: signal peptidase II [Candidatus Dependentiae bacterium]|nr:signal peptidase II [Candidatus Dependentiae bacterium]
MNRPMHFFQYIIVFLFCFQIDRITKGLALERAVDRYEINQFLSFELVFNRGVTGGLFGSDSPLLFLLLSLFIASIIAVLAVYAYFRWREDKSILGEVLTLAGAISNLLDRVLYQGVIDFVVLSWGDYTFPVFNIADVCIVLGVAIIFFVHVRE